MSNYAYDIYLNYSPKDNTDSWVERFLKVLEQSLLQLSGSIRILRYANGESPTAHTLSQVAIMLCVVSPNFNNDSNCIEDLDNFLQSASLNKERRLLKIFKLPTPIHLQHSALQNLSAHYFYQEQEGEFVPIQDFFGKETEKIFWVQILDLAQEIYLALQNLHHKKDFIQKTTPHTSKVVFLAHTTEDLQIERNLLKRELQKWGCLVLPQENLPQNLLELENLLKADLERSELAIHLIGSKYGEPLREEGVSLAELQNNLSADHNTMLLATQNSIYDSRKNFMRILWMPPHLKFDSEKQKVFVDNLTQGVEAAEATEILQVPLEDLKKMLKKILIANEQEEPLNLLKPAADLAKGEAIYLIYDLIDRDDALKIATFLKNQGYKVIEPSFSNTLLERRKTHIQNLVVCKAAYIYYGKIGRQWVATKILDLLKAPGFGREKPLQYKFVISKYEFQPDEFMQRNQIKSIVLKDTLWTELLETLQSIQ
jgi:uncharacterized protein YpmB